MRLKELENTQQNKAAEVAKLKLELDNAHADAASADERRRSEVETYKIRLKEIENRQQANAAAKLAKLQQERDQAKAAEASEELAKNQPGRSSELYQQAKSMFVEGKIDEAIKLVDESESTSPSLTLFFSPAVFRV